MNSLKFFALIGVTMFLSSCGGSQITTYKDTSPSMKFEEFFNGPIKAWGLVQDRSGKVTRRFDITMKGTWVGNEGTLEEHFEYYDGKTQDRTWKIKKISEGVYEGTASDIIGTAKGKTAGSAAQWAYTMDLEVDGTKYHVIFDDWMFQMNDGVLINRSYLKKFGITWGELTIFMQKQ